MDLSDAAGRIAMQAKVGDRLVGEGQTAGPARREGRSSRCAGKTALSRTTALRGQHHACWSCVEHRGCDCPRVAGARKGWSDHGTPRCTRSEEHSSRHHHSVPSRTRSSADVWNRVLSRCRLPSRIAGPPPRRSAGRCCPSPSPGRPRLQTRIRGRRCSYLTQIPRARDERRWPISPPAAFGGAVRHRGRSARRLTSAKWAQR